MIVSRESMPSPTKSASGDTIREIGAGHAPRRSGLRMERLYANSFDLQVGWLLRQKEAVMVARAVYCLISAVARILKSVRGAHDSVCVRVAGVGITFIR